MTNLEEKSELIPKPEATTQKSSLTEQELADKELKEAELKAENDRLIEEAETDYKRRLEELNKFRNKKSLEVQKRDKSTYLSCRKLGGNRIFCFYNGNPCFMIGPDCNYS